MVKSPLLSAFYEIPHFVPSVKSPRCDCRDALHSRKRGECGPSAVFRPLPDQNWQLNNRPYCTQKYSQANSTVSPPCSPNGFFTAAARASDSFLWPNPKLYIAFQLFFKKLLCPPLGLCQTAKPRLLLFHFAKQKEEMTAFHLSPLSFLTLYPKRGKESHCTVRRPAKFMRKKRAYLLSAGTPTLDLRAAIPGKAEPRLFLPLLPPSSFSSAPPFPASFSLFLFFLAE